MSDDVIEAMARAMLKSDGLEGFKQDTLETYCTAARAALRAAEKAGWRLVPAEAVRRVKVAYLEARKETWLSQSDLAWFLAEPIRALTPRRR